MGEGIRSGNAVVDAPPRKGGRPPEPPPDEGRAPNGWTWDRIAKEWRPKRKPGRRAAAEARTESVPPDDEPGGWQAERDPEPARLTADAEEAPREREPVKVTREVRDEIAASMGLVGMVVMPIVARRDPYCGGALAAQWGAISEACVPLLSRSPAVVRWMTSAGGGLRDWVGLAMAMAPVATAVVQHHVTKTVRLEDTPEGPVAVETDLSAYTA